ncbi:MAG: hypothetical protein ACRDHC_05190 [Actinomycetota bacterium]
MKRHAALLVLLALAVVSCGRLADDGPASGGGEPAPEEPDATRVEIYASAFRALAETEGWFDPVLLDERICPDAGAVGGMGEPAPCTQAFTEAEQAAILFELTDIPNARFVADAKQVEDRIFEGELQGAGLLTVGEIDGDGDRIEVGGRSYCGGVCAHFMTLVLERGPDGWTVTGTTGPVSIA